MTTAGAPMRAGAAAAAPVAAEAAPSKPYRGLPPFTEQDARYFFGREADRDAIIDSLRARRLTILYGPSGVGKSSVLNAGVSARLKGIARRNTERHGRPEYVLVSFATWSGDVTADLLASVRAALDAARLTMNAVRTADGDLELPPVGELPPAVTFEASDTPALGPTLTRWCDLIGCRLLLILDQFEEYFRYQPSATAPHSFGAQLVDVVNDLDAPVSVLVAIREDALSLLDRFRGHIAGVYDYIVRLDHLGRTEAARAIREPIRRFNEDTGSAFTIEDALVEALLDQVSVRPADVGAGLQTDRSAVDADGGVIQAPLLQLVMDELWSTDPGWREVGQRADPMLRLRTLDALAERDRNGRVTMTGAQRIARDYLDGAFGRLDRREKKIAADIVPALVTPLGKYAYTASELADDSSIAATSNEIDRVLVRLASSGAGMRQLLRPIGGSSETRHSHEIRYELIHDVIGPALLGWRRDFLRSLRQRQEWSRRIAVGAPVMVLVGGLLVSEMRAREAGARAESEAQRVVLDFKRGVVENELLATLRENAISEGWLELGEGVVDTLGQGATKDTTITIAAGATYYVAGRCDTECSDLDIQLFRGDRLVAADTAMLDDTPFLRWRADSSGNYRLTTTMKECAATGTCFFAVQPYYTPDTTSMAARRVTTYAGEYGLRWTGDSTTRRMARGTTGEWDVRIPGPGSYAVVAACALVCDLDAVVRAGRELLDGDSTTSARAILSFTAAAAGVHHVTLAMSSCGGRGECPVSARLYRIDARSFMDREFREIEKDLVRRRPPYEATTDTIVSSLGSRDSASFPVRLQAGRSYTLYGVCDTRCLDLDLRLTLDGRLIAADTLSDDKPLIFVNVQSAGNYRVTATMARCSAERCTYGVLPFIRRQPNLPAGTARRRGS